MTNRSETASGAISGVARHTEHLQRHAHGCECQCFIIPHDVLERFARDKKLSAEARKAFADAAKFEKEWRKVRAARNRF